MARLNTQPPALLRSWGGTCPARPGSSGATGGLGEEVAAGFAGPCSLRSHPSGASRVSFPGRLAEGFPLPLPDRIQLSNVLVQFHQVGPSRADTGQSPPSPPALPPPGAAGAGEGGERLPGPAAAPHFPSFCRRISCCSEQTCATSPRDGDEATRGTSSAQSAPFAPSPPRPAPPWSQSPAALRRRPPGLNPPRSPAGASLRVGVPRPPPSGGWRQ